MYLFASIVVIRPIIGRYIAIPSFISTPLDNPVGSLYINKNATNGSKMHSTITKYPIMICSDLFLNKNILIKATAPPSMVNTSSTGLSDTLYIVSLRKPGDGLSLVAKLNTNCKKNVMLARSKNTLWIR